MKKILFAVISLFLICGCGVGTYSLSSGKADVAELSFVANEAYGIVVEIDNSNKYELSTIKEKAYKSGRDIKNTALNTVKLVPGKHLVKVSVADKSVYTQHIFVSAGEHKIIEL